MHHGGFGDDASLDFHFGACDFPRRRFGHTVRKDTNVRGLPYNTPNSWVFDKEVFDTFGADNEENS